MPIVATIALLVVMLTATRHIIREERAAAYLRARRVF